MSGDYAMIDLPLSVLGRNLLIEEATFVPNSAWFIPRADTAKFMLDCLIYDTWNTKMVAIGLPK